MSVIKNLKTNNEHVFNIIEMIEMFIPNKKSKYTNLLVRLMKTSPNTEEHANDIKDYYIKKFPFINQDDLSKLSMLQIFLLHSFLKDFFQDEHLEKFRLFCEYNERGLVEQNDLSKYTTLEEIIRQVDMADLKVESKEMEKEVRKLRDDSEWLVLRPLTYMASKKYGANTKWCTTNNGDPQYFVKYSCKGVLIYCLNKKTGLKVASYKSLIEGEKEFSFWDQEDTRIDSLESNLPDDILKLIRETSLNPKAQTNGELLSEEEIQKQKKYLVNRMSRSDINEYFNIRKNGYKLKKKDYVGEPEMELPTDDREALIDLPNDFSDVFNNTATNYNYIDGFRVSRDTPLSIVRVNHTPMQDPIPDGEDDLDDVVRNVFGN